MDPLVCTSHAAGLDPHLPAKRSHMPPHTPHHSFTQLGSIPAFKLFNSTESDVLRLLFEHRPADSQVGVFTLVWDV